MMTTVRRISAQERWEEMDWDSNGDISFGEFVYAFTKWVDFEGEDDTVEHQVRGVICAFPPPSLWLSGLFVFLACQCTIFSPLHSSPLPFSF